MNQKQVQPTTRNNDSQKIVPYNVHIQAGFDNPLINRKVIIYLGISAISLTFKVSTRIRGNVSIRAAFQNFKFKCLWNKK